MQFLKQLKWQHNHTKLLRSYYYDRDIKQKDDNPTIGLVLCAKENDAIVKYTLPEDNKQIFARKYQLHLPTVDELKKEVSREYEAVLGRFRSKSDDE